MRVIYDVLTMELQISLLNTEDKRGPGRNINHNHCGLKSAVGVRRRKEQTGSDPAAGKPVTFSSQGEGSFSLLGLLLERRRNHSSNKYLLSNSSVPDTVLGSEFTVVNETDENLSLCENGVSRDWNEDSKASRSSQPSVRNRVRGGLHCGELGAREGPGPGAWSLIGWGPQVGADRGSHPTGVGSHWGVLSRGVSRSPI